MVEPGGQAYPALQFPLHADEFMPGTEPKVPPGHRDVHAGEVRPGASPYDPAGQALQDAAPAREYCPRGHSWDVELVEAAGQAYPAVQLPLQAADPRAVALPKTPGGQSTHNQAPERLYLPTGQDAAVALVDPAAHT